MVVYWSAHQVTHTFGIECESAGIKFGIEVEVTAMVISAGEDGEGGHAEIVDLMYPTPVSDHNTSPVRLMAGGLKNILPAELIESWARTIFNAHTDHEDIYEGRDSAFGVHSS